jgi:hypothetical protein
MWVIVLEDWTALNHYLQEWEDLAESALEPNPFYEPWMLLPALESFSGGRSPRIALVFAPHPLRKLDPPILCGLFPLEVRQRYRGLPIRHYRLWDHKYLSLCTPLIRAEYTRDCLGTFFDWVATNPDGCSLIELGSVSGEGLFNQALVDTLNERAKLSFVSDCFTRALFRPRQDADSYLTAALRGTHRKDLRRKEKRLSDAGLVEYDELDSDGDIERWTREFLDVEASGWKGQEGSALAAGEASRSFFVRVASSAFSRGRLMMLALRFNGRPIALKFNLLARSGAFSLKIGYDESYARFSPGLLLEVENVRRLHERGDVEWMDSCAVSEHFMINRLWLDRRTIQTVLIPTGKGAGDLWVSMMPLVRWLNRRRLTLTNRKSKKSN